MKFPLIFFMWTQYRQKKKNFIKIRNWRGGILSKVISELFAEEAELVARSTEKVKKNDDDGVQLVDKEEGLEGNFLRVEEPKRKGP